MASNILLRRRSNKSRPAPGYVPARVTGTILMLCDIALSLLVALAYVLSPLAAPLREADDHYALIAIFLCYPLAKLASGLYPGHGRTRSMRLRQALLALLAGNLAVLAIALVMQIALLGQPGDLGTVGFWASLAGCMGLVSLVLLIDDPILRRVLLKRGKWCEPVFVFGGGDVASEVIRQLHLDPHLGYKPICLVDDNAVYLPEDEQGVPYVRSKELARHAQQLESCTTALVIDHVVERSSLLRLYLSGIFAQVLLVPDCHDLISLKSAVRNLGGILTLRLVSGRPSPVVAFIKRSFDLVASSLALLLASPLLGLIALAVRLDSQGPVLFSQPRWGGEDRSFRALKFRSMHTDADRRLQRYFITNPAAQQEYERFHKLDNDPRVTRIGRFLRVSSLDELPQLINVLRGEMSVVGPRPYTLDELKKLGVARLILSQIRPGVTGFWQVSGRNQRTFRERIAMDCYYVRNMSISLDLWIIYRTVISVITADGK